MIVTATGNVKCPSKGDALITIINELNSNGFVAIEPPVLTKQDKCGHYKYSCRVRSAVDYTHEMTGNSPAWKGGN